jgi:excisionase family DNA binding protein
MQLLGVGSTTIKRWADQDKLPFIRTIGGHRRFRRDAVDQLLQQHPVKDKDSAIHEWIQLLTEESDVMRISNEISQLRHELGDWYDAADFLDNVMREFRNRGSDDAESEAWSLIAAGRLDLALCVISSSFVVKPTAPIALLATFGRREHSHRSALIEICAKSEAMEVLRADAKTPARELTLQIRGRDQRVIILSAPDQCKDCELLVRANREISAACQEEDVDLVVGFGLDRPDFGDYGYNYNSFGDLKDVLQLLKLDTETASNN